MIKWGKTSLYVTYPWELTTYYLRDVVFQFQVIKRSSGYYLEHLVWMEARIHFYKWCGKGRIPLIFLKVKTKQSITFDMKKTFLKYLNVYSLVFFRKKRHQCVIKKQVPKLFKGNCEIYRKQNPGCFPLFLEQIKYNA